MDAEPILHHYRVSDRAEVLDFLREVFPAHRAAQKIAQWTWQYESSPFTSEDGPAVNFIRVGGKLVGLSAGTRLRMWMGGIECFGESRNDWIVHPDFRKQNLWRRAKALKATESPILFGWSQRGPALYTRFKWVGDPVRPLIRILDAGPLLAHFARSGILASVGTGVSHSMRIFTQPSRRNSTVVRLDRFDERADALWERARHPSGAMIVREHRYLNWRYCERPDVPYFLYGAGRGAELEGFLVARVTTWRGMRWGYLVDFLAPENSPGILSSLIAAALDELRSLGAAGVATFATDRTARRALFRSGFLPLPQRNPVHFIRFIRSEQTELAKFVPFAPWYVTMGDGDFEMLF
jgi:hypothetical protein